MQIRHLIYLSIINKIKKLSLPPLSLFLFLYFPPPLSLSLSLRGAMAKVLDCSLEGSKFELHLNHYICFRINALVNMHPLYLHSDALNSVNDALLQG